jgi:hypothetical protein
MPNKSKKRWLDVQIILASLAVTSTVALWNGFVRAASPVSGQTGLSTPDPTATMSSTTEPTAAATATAIATATVDPNAIIRLPKVHILLGGQLPVPQVVVAAQPSVSVKANNQVSSTGGGSGTTGSPAPVTTTSSSKP